MTTPDAPQPAAEQPRPIDDRELELLADTGLTGEDMKKAIGAQRDELGIPAPGTPEFAAMQQRLWAGRTKEEAAAFDTEQIAGLESQFPNESNDSQ